MALRRRRSEEAAAEKESVESDSHSLSLNHSRFPMKPLIQFQKKMMIFHPHRKIIHRNQNLLTSWKEAAQI